MTEAEILAEFPGTAGRHYLNAAAASLLPRSVGEAMAEAARAQVARGILTWSEDMRRVAAAREAAARLLGASPSDVAFVANTAEAVARVADGLDWRDGDEVVLGDLEYPANVYPWAAQADRGARIRLVRSEDGRLPAERLVEAIGPRTRVVAVSHVQFSTGYRVDLEPLGAACAARGVLLAVDAIQGLGVFPVDVQRLGIGVLAADGRKWLMGPSGTGILCVAPEWTARIRPRAVGALSVTGSEDLLSWAGRVDGAGRLEIEAMLRDGAGRFEAGYPNVVSLAGLRAALDLGERIGRATILERVQARVSRLIEGLASRGLRVHGPRTAEERSGIVSFELPGDAVGHWKRLGERGILVAARDGRLRAAPHVYNTDDDVDALLEALAAL